MDPIFDLQAALVPRLKSFPALAALVAGRIYDRIPADGNGQPVADFPYVSIGSAGALDNGYECIDGVEVSFRIDAWSDAPSYGEVMRIAGAIRQALHEVDLELAHNALVEIRHRRTDRMRDPDGLTSHAVIEFTATIEIP